MPQDPRTQTQQAPAVGAPAGADPADVDLGEVALDPLADEVRSALEAEGGVRVHDLEVRVDGDDLVLAGRVASPEEAARAEHLARERAEAIRPELVVDPGLRDDPSAADVDPLGETPAQEVYGDGLSGHGDEFDRSAGGGATTDFHEAMAESEPWDPPTEATDVPTQREERDERSL